MKRRAERSFWATDAVIHYVFPGTEFTAFKKVNVTWYDGDRRPSSEIVGQAGGKLPDQGSVFLGTEGVMVLPHISKPKLLPTENFAEFKMPEVKGANHWHQFVEAILGKDKTQANFDYAGPLTEAVLLVAWPRASKDNARLECREVEVHQREGSEPVCAAQVSEGLGSLRAFVNRFPTATSPTAFVLAPHDPPKDRPHLLRPGSRNHFCSTAAC